MVGVSSYSSEAIGSLLGALKFELEFLAFTCTHSLSGTCIFIGKPLLQHILTPGARHFPEHLLQLHWISVIYLAPKMPVLVAG